MPRNIIPEEAERRARKKEERAAEDKRQKELW